MRVLFGGDKMIPILRWFRFFSEIVAEYLKVALHPPAIRPAEKRKMKKKEANRAITLTLPAPFVRKFTHNI